MSHSPKASRAPVMVLAGEFWNGSAELGLADGFSKLGWAVQKVDSARYYPDLGAGLGSRVIRRIIAPLAEQEFRFAIFEACRALEPDVFLSVKGTHITVELLHSIKKIGATAAVFYPDFHFDHRGISLEVFALYDRIITTKTFQVPYLRERFGASKVSYVPHGYLSTVHWPVYRELGESQYTVDLQHAGACSPYKLKWLLRVREHLPETSLRIFGARWVKTAKGSPLAQSVSDCSLYAHAYSAALQTARINIAVHFGPHASGWHDYVSTRTFEIPACRGFMLHVDNEEVREFFTPGKEIDVFSTPQELADKIRFYLARPDLRAAMIDKAHARCVPAYSYDARARSIAGLLGVKPN
jgi:spore maturation protein CgeB